MVVASSSHGIMEKTWKIPYMPKVCIFQWILLHNKIVTSDDLVKKKLKQITFAIRAKKIKILQNTSFCIVFLLEQYSLATPYIPYLIDGHNHTSFIRWLEYWLEQYMKVILHQSQILQIRFILWRFWLVFILTPCSVCIIFEGTHKCPFREREGLVAFLLIKGVEVHIYFTGHEHVIQVERSFTFSKRLLFWRFRILAFAEHMTTYFFPLSFLHCIFFSRPMLNFFGYFSQLPSL